MRLLFVPVEWMHYYLGDVYEGSVLPKCAYNFQYMNGKYYGLADGTKEIPLEHFEGISKEANQVEGVTVVWVSKTLEGESKIIGWYKNAIVYRTPQRKITLDNERVELIYSMEVNVEGAILLPLEERRFVLPKAQEGIWFEEDKAYACDIAAYIHHYTGEKINTYVPKENLLKQVSLTFDDYERYLIKADEFQNKSFYDKAIRWCNKAINEAPEISLAYECKGNILLSLKMYDEALEVYKKLIELDELNQDYRYCLGLCYALKEEYNTALSYYNRYLEDEQDASVIADRGVVFYNMGLYAKAKRDFETARKLEQDNPFFEELQVYCGV